MGAIIERPRRATLKMDQKYGQASMGDASSKMPQCGKYDGFEPGGADRSD